jgi:hypothetical protein
MSRKEFIKNQALINLSSSELKNHSLTNSDLAILSGWTYLGIFLFEAKTSLSLSEKFNSKTSKIEMEDMILIHSLFRNSILSYAKCFSSANGKRIKLDASNVFSKRADLLKIHEQMMEIRNTFVAHNSDNEYDLALAVVNEEKEQIELAQTYHLLLPTADFQKFNSAIEHCQYEVILKLNSKADKIEAKIGKQINFR